MNTMTKKVFEKHFETARAAMDVFDVQLKSRRIADNREELVVNRQVLALVSIPSDSIPLPKNTVVRTMNTERIYYAKGELDGEVHLFPSTNPLYSHSITTVPIAAAVFAVLEFPGIREEVLKLALRNNIECEYIPRSYETLEKALSEVKKKYNDKYPDLSINWEMLKGLRL